MNYKDFSELPPLLADYLLYDQTVKNRSSLTIDEYCRDLSLFFQYMIILKNKLDEDSVDITQIDIKNIDIDFIKRITLNDAYMFIVYCKNKRSNNAKTRSRKISAIRGFFKYITNKKGLLTANPMEELETPKTKKSLPKYLTLDQSINLLDAVDGENKARDYLIITLFLNCGLRLSELCALNLGDIIDGKTLKVTGKGNKERIVYLNDACKSAISSYLKVRPVDGVKDKNALFISRQKNRISNKTVQWIVYKYLEKIGIKGGQANGYSVHKLRHTAATLMYQHGHVDIRVLKDLLGHENLGTTEIYTHLSDKDIERAALSNPLSKINREKSENKT